MTVVMLLVALIWAALTIWFWVWCLSALLPRRRARAEAKGKSPNDLAPWDAL